MNTPYFSCHNCKHSAKARNPVWTECKHPEVIKADFDSNDLEKYTDADKEKLTYLVNDVLHLQITSVGGRTPNFEFPFQYEATWITGCNGFEQFKKRDVGHYKWLSGKNG